MKKLFETKKQHYVPRFILRHFSPDKRSISLVVLKTGRRVDGASIARQCCGDYFYGADGKMEKAFGDEETNVSLILADTSPAALEHLTPLQLGDLRKFMHWQRARTQGTVDLLNTQADAIVKTLMREDLALNPQPGLAKDDLDLVKVTLTAPQARAIYAASQTLPLIFDLAIKFVVAPSISEFVISDHPVVVSNQFVEHNEFLSQRRGWTGLAVKGLQMFLPISPKVILAMYDPGTYEYGSPKKLVCPASIHDVAVLNKLQAITAVDALYFASSFPDTLIEKLRGERGAHRPIRESEVTLGKIIKGPDGNYSRLMAVAGVQPLLGRKFSFVKLLERRSYRDYRGAIIPVRNDELLRFADGFAEYLDEKVETMRRNRST